LEKEGLIRSVAGKGFYACEYNTDYLMEKQLVMIEKRLTEVITEAKQAGLSCEKLKKWWMHYSNRGRVKIDGRDDLRVYKCDR